MARLPNIDHEWAHRRRRYCPVCGQAFYSIDMARHHARWDYGTGRWRRCLGAGRETRWKDLEVAP